VGALEGLRPENGLFDPISLALEHHVITVHAHADRPNDSPELLSQCRYLVGIQLLLQIRNQIVVALAKLR
jgi:hypothetical protein